jgi:hypothetical protein
MKSPPSVRLALRPSRIGAWSIAAATLATAGLVGWLPADAVLRALAVIGIAVHGLWSLCRVAQLGLPSSIVEAELAADRAATLIRRDGGRIAGSAAAESYVGAWVVTLVLRDSARGRKHALLLLPDMANAEELRRFRLLLRLGRSEKT